MRAFEWKLALQDPILISLDFYMNFTRMIKSFVNPRFSASSSIFKTEVINMKLKVVTHELCVKWIAFQYAWCIKTLIDSTVLSSLSRALTSNFLSNLLIHKKKVLCLSWKDLLRTGYISYACVNCDFQLVNTPSPILAFLHVHVHVTSL